MRRINLCFLLLVMTFYLERAIACDPEMIVPDEYLVRVKNFNSSAQSQSLRSKTSFDYLESAKCLNCNSYEDKISSASAQKLNSKKKPKSKLYTLKLNPRELTDLAQDERVLSVEPNCMVELQSQQVVPNDPFFSSQWALSSISAERAWSVTQGSRSIVVAISDTGVDYNHPDLRNQMWINEVEANGTPGVDDDGNGCIDDIYGCDVADADGDPMPGNAISSGHGTHVAGIVGAIGNNAVGISGVAWNVRIMAVKGFYDSENSTTLSALIETIYYAVNNGADIINCSWGSRASPTQAERDAFAYAFSNGVTAIVAAGNGKVAATEYSPAAITTAITVGSYNSRENLSSFSNFGSGVDIVAPGGDAPSSGGYEEAIYSTLPVRSGSYGGIQGTSMAAPHVAGAVALMLSINPRLTPSDVTSILKNSSPRFSFVTEGGSAQASTYPKLDLFKTLEYTYRLTNCNGENCSLSGGLGGGPSGLSTAISSGMGGCNQIETAEASNAQVSIFLLIFLLPLLGRAFLKRLR